MDKILFEKEDQGMLIENELNKLRYGDQICLEINIQEYI